MTALAPPHTNGAPDARWHRLHPLSPLVRAGRALVPLIVLVLSTGLGSGQRHDLRWHLLTEGSIAVVALIVGVVTWLVTRWQVVDGVLRIDTGLVRRTSHRYPLSQVQAIDIVESGMARMFGLAELRLRMAGSGRGKSRLAYLPVEQTKALRTNLLTIGHGTARSQSAAYVPERVLLRLPTSMLIASIVLSGAGLTTLAITVGLLTLAVLTPSTAAALVSAAAASILALLTAVWRRFNGYYNLELAEAGDGFRLRSGLIQTSSETIPIQRVQAVRLLEPFLWRPMGWCRLEVAVAGRKREQENEAEGRRLRAVLPVGDRAQAQAVLERLVPPTLTGRALVAGRKPPARARWKAPLSFHNLAWDGDDRCLVTASGRLRRSTQWVPLAKVQAIRFVQGPIQRRLHLATVHLDVPGRNVHAALRDRGTDEVEQVLALLPARCRAARRLTDRTRSGATVYEPLRSGRP